MSDHQHPTTMPTACLMSAVEILRSGEWRTSGLAALRLAGELQAVGSYLCLKKADALQDLPDGVVHAVADVCEGEEEVLAAELALLREPGAPARTGGGFLREELLRWVWVTLNDPRFLDLVLSFIGK